MVTMVMCRVLMTVANRRLSAPLSFPEAAQRLHSWPGSCLRRASRSEYLSTSSGRSGDRRPAGLLAASQHPGRRGAAASRDPRGLLCGLHAGPHRPQHRPVLGDLELGHAHSFGMRHVMPVGKLNAAVQTTNCPQRTAQEGLLPLLLWSCQRRPSLPSCLCPALTQNARCCAAAASKAAHQE